LVLLNKENFRVRHFFSWVLGGRKWCRVSVK
jgi:hypothetical protein